MYNLTFLNASKKYKSDGRTLFVPPPWVPKNNRHAGIPVILQLSAIHPEAAAISRGIGDSNIIHSSVRRWV
jgi:hypothetical protein